MLWEQRWRYAQLYLDRGKGWAVNFKDYELSYERWKGLTKYTRAMRHPRDMKRLVLRPNCAEMYSTLGHYQWLVPFPKLSQRGLSKIKSALNGSVALYPSRQHHKVLNMESSELFLDRKDPRASPAFSLITDRPHFPSVT